LKKAKRLYIIFNAFIRTIPAFVNVGGLIMVLIYIFTVLGSRLFAKTKLEGSSALNDHNRNFQTFGNSFLTLIIVMTGEGWYQIMEDYSKQSTIGSECLKDPSWQDYVENGYQTIGCGNQTQSLLFFCFYVFVVSLILLNLFIAVTLQGFNEVSSEDSCRITDY
jgi:voltage-gated cation channel